MWHVTCDTWHMTRDMWHVTHLGRWTFSPNFSSLAPTVWELYYFEYISTNHDWITELNNDRLCHRSVCRTGPTTPGLLKSGLNTGIGRKGLGLNLFPNVFGALFFGAIYLGKVPKWWGDEGLAKRFGSLLRDIASLHINLCLKTVQLSPPIFGHFCQ